MSIRKRQLKSGKTVYDVMLRTPAGVQISRTFPTRKAAETFEATEKADRARGGWIDPRKASTTFAEVAAKWLDANPAKRPGPRRRDEGVRKHLVQPSVVALSGRSRPPMFRRSSTTGAGAGRRRIRFAASTAPSTPSASTRSCATSSPARLAGASSCRAPPMSCGASSPARSWPPWLTPSDRSTGRWCTSEQSSGCGGGRWPGCASGASTSCAAL